MSDDRNPYPPQGQASEPDPLPTEVLPAADAAQAPESAPDAEPHLAGTALVGAEIGTRLAALDQLYEAKAITAAELGEARRRVLAGAPAEATSYAPAGPPPPIMATPIEPAAASQAQVGSGGTPPPVVTEHIGSPPPPEPKKILGMPVALAAGIAAALVVGLIAIGLILILGGGGDDDTPPVAEGPTYAAQIKVPLNQLTASVVVVGKGLARASNPADLTALNRLAERQIDAVEAARKSLSTIKVSPDNRAAQQRLIAAAATHRRFLVQLGRATDGTPTEASLAAANRARRAGGETLAAYKRFFALAAEAPDAITATDITDTSGLRAAIQKSIDAAASPGTEDGGTTKPNGPYSSGSFQSPTGNLRCQISGSNLFCSSSNDGFGVVLPGFGAPSTGTGQASGGQSVPYGSSWSSGLFRCDSAFDGITCYNQSGNGFFLNRDSYNPF